MTDLYDELWKRLKRAAQAYAASPSAFAGNPDEIAAGIIDEMDPAIHSDARDFYMGEFQAIVEECSRGGVPETEIA